MDFNNLKRSTDWFRVESLRKIEDPSGQIDRREMVVSLDQFPHDIGLGPNPRRPDRQSRVSRDISNTLHEDAQRVLKRDKTTFHLLNRGITILAKDLDYDNKTERGRLHLHETEDEATDYGILDGGNTHAQINEFRKEITDDDVGLDILRNIFVNVQVLVPRGQSTEDVQNLLNDIKEARNNSVQVKQKSLADARHHYDLLKNILQAEPYFQEISWREGDKGQIDVLTILTILMLFFPRFSEEAPDKEPNGAYGRKEKCLDAFLSYSEDPDVAPLLTQYLHQLPSILRLFDQMQYEFAGFHGGRFGGITEVRIYDEKKYEKGNKRYRKSPVYTTFLRRAMKYEYPTGWLYPLIAGFRVLLNPVPGSSDVGWKRNPLEFWQRHGEEICNRCEPYFKVLGYDTRRIGSSATTYASMRAAITDVYKSELLQEAGISA